MKRRFLNEKSDQWMSQPVLDNKRENTKGCFVNWQLMVENSKSLSHSATSNLAGIRPWLEKGDKNNGVITQNVE